MISSARVEEQRKKYDFDCVICMSLADVEAFLVYRKFEFELAYLGLCSPKKDTWLLDSYYFGNSPWGVLGIVVRRVSVRYILCKIYVVSNGMYRSV